ncbi:TBC1 domain protein [Wickerhamomyces ciferrii]|uniref:TBC1 domain protein n=1 Tax=Wickerhamomyces ciferrii (strain ATCC 14091 / BCRC 22168 / CBS 111 / JCM 3599 / NBRC 0793 / NRRL Y-1031 F-60-10) TaxID=1206466 RepID=K0KWQ9_WICCF|nr:TBC1 domain protein [Wickerhamomyces ciferrii]CCH45929.1 TBC1 domain protein [Wickerhamomyces ciferrii]
MAKMDPEQFDDVDINLDSFSSRQHQTLARHSSLNYLYRKNKSVQYIGSHDSINRSTTNLINNNSHDNLGKMNKYTQQNKPLPPSPVKELEKNNQVSMVPTKPNYSPSKKLHKKREIPKDDWKQLHDFDNDSEGDLDDTILIYDVPLSQSLVQLTSHQKPIQPPSRLHSLASDTTYTSSIMSSQYSIDSESDMETLNTDAKQIAWEMSRSKSVLAIQESSMRRHIISNFDRPKSTDSQNLPHSDLKGKFINGTRQDNLPPKQKEESQAHLQAFQKIKSRAIKKELELEKTKLKQLELRKSQQQQDLNKWERTVIPNFVQQVQLAETRELWWRGIPSKLREFIWTEQIGIKIPLQEISKLHIQALKLIDSNTELVQLIRKDIRSIFPDVPALQTTLYHKLLTLLVMYSNYKSYQSGLSTLAGVILYNVHDLNSSFLCLVGILQKNLMKLLYNNQIDDFNIESNSFLRTFEKKNPQLYHHFQLSLKLTPWEYLEPLIKPIFSNHLPIEIVSSILDIYIFEGDSILWRCVLGLFNKIGYKLYGNKDEVLEVIGWDALQKLNKGKNNQWFRYLDVGDDYEFINIVREVLKRK